MNTITIHYRYLAIPGPRCAKEKSPMVVLAAIDKIPQMSSRPSQGEKQLVFIKYSTVTSLRNVIISNLSALELPLLLSSRALIHIQIG